MSKKQHLASIVALVFGLAACADGSRPMFTDVGAIEKAQTAPAATPANLGVDQGQEGDVQESDVDDNDVEDGDVEEANDVDDADEDDVDDGDIEDADDEEADDEEEDDSEKGDGDDVKEQVGNQNGTK